MNENVKEKVISNNKNGMQMMLVISAIYAFSIFLLVVTAIGQTVRQCL